MVIKKVNEEKMTYVKNSNSNERIFRTELLLAPLLILSPFIVGIIFINDWYVRGFLEGSSAFDGELILGIVIIILNILFDIPFIKSLRNFKILFRRLKE